MNKDYRNSEYANNMAITDIPLNESDLTIEQRTLYDKLRKERNSNNYDMCNAELLDLILYGEQAETDDDGNNDYSNSLKLIEYIIREMMEARSMPSRANH